MRGWYPAFLPFRAGPTDHDLSRDIPRGQAADGGVR